MRAATLLAALLVVTPAFAQDELDDVFEGFDDEAAPAAEPDEPRPSAGRFWELSGAATLSASSNFQQRAPRPGEPDYRGLSKLRGELALQLDLELPRGWDARIAGRGFRDYRYAINGRSDWAHSALDSYQSELEFQELWLRGSLRDDLDLKFGRQVVVWGRADTIRVLDVLNPLDNREPGLVDVEDLRLPVTMTRLDYYWRRWNLTAMAIHEVRFSEDPAFNHEYLPLPGSVSRDPNMPPPIPSADKPSSGGSNTEWAAALNGTFSGWDVSLHWARYFDDAALLQSAGGASLISRYPRVTLLGIGANLARGNWLWKAEAAHISGLKYGEITPSGPNSARRDRVDVMLGFEYGGFAESAVAFEIAQRHIRDFDSDFLGADLSFLGTSAVGLQQDTVQAILRYTHDLRHDTVHLTGLVGAIGWKADDGALARFSVAYDVRDAVTISGGVMLYRGGDLLAFDGIRNNDRVFVNAKYSF